MEVYVGLDVSLILSCPFHAMSRTACGSASMRSRSFRLTRACIR